jgi:CubicO group peptidase (beta-lactamase class C family)
MNTTHLCRGFVTIGIAAAGAVAQTCDFSQVTALCNGALVGQNVNSPVPGFDLLLIHRGQVVYHQSFGSWSLNRVANIDSASKTLSGAVILSVTESNAQTFSLNSRISQFIPEFVVAKANITIRQAFSHTSGMRESSLLSSQSLTLQQVAAQIGDDPQIFVAGAGFAQPGQYFSYGGASMHAAGAAAEVASGTSWNTLVTQRFTAPDRLNLPNTRFVLSTPGNPRIAGGAESTATEFGRFMEMLRRGGTFGGRRYLSRASVEAMFTRQSPEGVPVLSSPLQDATDPADYGVGVWLTSRTQDGQLLSALAAGARGFASWIDFDDQIVGVFATDVSASGNVQQLYALLGQAAQAAIRACRPCDPIDFNRDGVFPDDTDVIDFF